MNISVLIIVNRNCAGIDVHKKIIVVTIAKTNEHDITDYQTKSFTTFTDDLIKKCVTTQKKLIKKASKLLNSGGMLVYSTCSLLRCENEDIVDFALENGFEIDFCKIKVNEDSFSDGSSVNENVYIKIFPDKIWEGFFVAKLHKK